MSDSNEWVEMINQEIKELQRLLDRKAEQKQVAKFQAAYTKKKQVQFNKKLQNPNEQNTDETSDLSNENDHLDEAFSHINLPTDEKERKSHKFGNDISSDFTTLFGAFNRVAKQKLDNAILSDFYSVSLIDSIYQKRSTQFSAQVTESCQLYYQLFDEKITELSTKISLFHQTITQRLNEIDYVTQALQKRLNRIYVNRRHVVSKDNEDYSDESSSEVTSRMSARLSGRLSARLPDNPKMRRQHTPLSFQKMSDFSKTVQTKIVPLSLQNDSDD